MDFTHIAIIDNARPSRPAIDLMDLLAITDPDLYTLIGVNSGRGRIMPGQKGPYTDLRR